MSKVMCTICPHHCCLDENETGFCRARSNIGGTVTAVNYGLVTSIALDPIEKKPLYHFYPGSTILSVGSFGCNLRCPFCQNHEISMKGLSQAQTREILPGELVAMAVSLKNQGNIGIAYTYNEPLVGYEYVRDCAALARKSGQKNVLVTNGYICGKPLLKLLPDIDALNIDLKAFSDGFYKKISGDLETVKNTIRLASDRCHVEVTTLIIPGENDGEEEIRKLAQWLGSIRNDIPLHLTRFFPRYQMRDKNMTDAANLYALAKIARESLRFVHTGNC
ncbi:MAG: AmmeMemoRadiSam system radical SAM enzyme [Christensenellales bacterium]